METSTILLTVGFVTYVILNEFVRFEIFKQIRGINEYLSSVASDVAAFEVNLGTILEKNTNKLESLHNDHADTKESHNATREFFLTEFEKVDTVLNMTSDRVDALTKLVSKHSLALQAAGEKTRKTVKRAAKKKSK